MSTQQQNSNLMVNLADVDVWQKFLEILFKKHPYFRSMPINQFRRDYNCGRTLVDTEPGTYCNNGGSEELYHHLEELNFILGRIPYDSYILMNLQNLYENLPKIRGRLTKPVA